MDLINNRRYINFFTSSNPVDGAINVSSDGSRFSMPLSDPLVIPRNAYNVQLDFLQAQMYNSFPNIFSGGQSNPQNNLMYFVYLGASYLLTIPQGQYDFTSFQDLVESFESLNSIPVGTFLFSANANTGYVTLYINAYNSSVDFTQPNTPRLLLGFNAVLLATTITYLSFTAANYAHFNTVDFVILHSSLVPGILLNGIYNQNCLQCFITSGPGEIFVTEPINSSPLPADNLIGTSTSSIDFYITDQSQNALDTGGEFYYARIRVSYSLV